MLFVQMIFLFFSEETKSAIDKTSILFFNNLLLFIKKKRKRE